MFKRKCFCNQIAHHCEIYGSKEYNTIRPFSPSVTKLNVAVHENGCMSSFAKQMCHGKFKGELGGSIQNHFVRLCRPHFFLCMKHIGKPLSMSCFVIKSTNNMDQLDCLQSSGPICGFETTWAFPCTIARV